MAGASRSTAGGGGLGRAALERLAEDYRVACGVLRTQPLESVSRALGGLARSLEVQRGAFVGRLGLAGLGLQCVDAQALAACLPAVGIYELALEGNAVGDAGVVALCTVLAPRGGVTRLELTGNRVTELGALAVERALQVGRAHGVQVDLRRNPGVPKALLLRLLSLQSRPSPSPAPRSPLSTLPTSRKPPVEGPRSAAVSIAGLVEACAGAPGVVEPRETALGQQDAAVQTPPPARRPKEPPSQGESEGAGAPAAMGAWRNLFMQLGTIELPDAGRPGRPRPVYSAERALMLGEIQHGLKEIEGLMARGLLQHLRGRVEELEGGLDTFERRVRSPFRRSPGPR